MVTESDLDEKHGAILQAAYWQSKEIFDRSPQPMYLYFDDTHKICNKPFADMLGYSSPDEWAGEAKPFLHTFTASDSHTILARSYRRAVEDCEASCVDVEWKTKDGRSVATKVVLVPVVLGTQMLALHYVIRGV